MKYSSKFFVLTILLLLLNCGNSYDGKYKKEFNLLKNAWQDRDNRTYYNIMYDLVMKSDSLEGRKALLYYFFEFPYKNDTYLYKIQDAVKKFGFYEDWEVLDRFYERYEERYSREAVAKDSSLISVHQAYIQFLAVCNYEKIKPLYLHELSETIRDGDYTYAFNSYLLPEHWEEAADTLMKYYWSVKDEDTRRRMNSAIIKIKKTKALKHYKDVCRRETPKNINLLMFDFIDYGLTEINGDTWKYFSQFIKDENIRYRYIDGYHN